jgi:hypothetical protein
LDIKLKSNANHLGMQQFQADLLQSVRDMKAGRVGLTRRLTACTGHELAHSGLSTQKFAQAMQ